MDSGLILRSYRVILNQWTKWNSRSYKWLPKTSLICGFPIRKEILNVSQIGKAFHWVCPPIRRPLLAGAGSKDGSWEELACESLRSGTLSSMRFYLNSCSHSGISEQKKDYSILTRGFRSYMVLDFWLPWSTGLTVLSVRHVHLTQILDRNLSH